jgi:hypothetical protein
MTDDVVDATRPVEFARRREGMIYAMDGGLWLHRHRWNDRAMAHLVSTDKMRLLEYGRRVGLAPERLQYKPLKDPRTGQRKPAWHWDLVGRYIPAPGGGGASPASGTAARGDL